MASENTFNSRILWNKAGAAGAALGLTSAAFMFISQALAGVPSAIAVSVISLLLWGAKFAGSIWLMAYFMKRLSAEYTEISGKETFRFGTAAAFLSALIYSAAYLANILFISPGLVEESLEAVTGMYSSILDANSMSMLEKMIDNYPSISFFSNLIYCFLYGTVLSSILSRSIPPKDPFANAMDSYGNSNN